MCIIISYVKIFMMGKFGFMNKKKSSILLGFLAASAVILITVIIIFCVGKPNQGIKETSRSDSTAASSADISSQSSETGKKYIKIDPFLNSEAVKTDLLPVNEWSRPGIKLSKVNEIVIHYVANPGTTAAQNRSYFNNLATTHATQASSHYVVGLDGEIIQCVPLDEIAYASNDYNSHSISIENCHPDDSGEFNKATYDSLVKLTAALCKTYGLNPQTQVIRHYDVTKDGKPYRKECPKYFVDNPEEWEVFKAAVTLAIQ